MKLFSARILSKKSSSGFTLIELLVVIGILGILATALVATIDPFEQLKKASDANVKNTAVEYVDANIRYYTTHNGMPWAGTDTYGTSCGTAAGMSPSGPTTPVVLTTVTSSCLAELINDGELKTAFTTAVGVLSAITITGGTNSVTACFAPASRAQRNDGNTKYKLTAGTFATVTDGSCPNATMTNCYWCAQ
ncbi:MAG TPA: type II secretion system protein [Patescibacteria group bacterium]|nr:type II secretion system protein [Patescibacteria group bacterium]